MKSNLQLTKNESRYLKLIYKKQREESEKIKTSSIAEALDVRPSSVTEVFQGLAEKGLLEHNPYYGVRLTEEGVKMARERWRRHRILEVLFVKLLDYSPEKACEEAYGLDYHTSEGLINSICRSFDHPEVCPCGNRIFPNRNCSGGIESA